MIKARRPFFLARNDPRRPPPFAQVCVAAAQRPTSGLALDKQESEAGRTGTVAGGEHVPAHHPSSFLLEQACAKSSDEADEMKTQPRPMGLGGEM